MIGCLKYLAIHSFPRNTCVIFSWTLNSSVQSLLLLFLDVLRTNLLFSVSHYLSESVLEITKEYTTLGQTSIPLTMMGTNWSFFISVGS